MSNIDTITRRNNNTITIVIPMRNTFKNLKPYYSSVCAEDCLSLRNNPLYAEFVDRSLSRGKYYRGNSRK